MYKVLIVEDEMLVRLGLKNSVNWSKFQMKVIAEAADGKTALAIYEKEKPDLVITDIKMPVMDGMELISNIRSKDSRTKIIILSCLEEFELARKATYLGISGYLLKLTMTNEEIEDILLKIYNELMVYNTSMIEENESNVYLLKEDFIKKFIFYKHYSIEEFSVKMKQLNCRLDPERIVMCMMEIKYYSCFKDKFMDGKGELIRFSIANVLNEIFDGFNRGTFFHDNERTYVFIFSFPDILSESRIYDEVNEIIQRIGKVMDTYFNTSVFFGLSSLQNGYEHLSDMYHTCEKACSLGYFIEEATNTNWSCDLERNYLELAYQKYKEIPRNLHSLLLINEDQKEKIDLWMSKNIDRVFSVKKQVIDAFIKLMELLPELLEISKYKKPGSMTQFIDKVRECETFETTNNTFLSYVKEVCDISVRKYNYSKGINNVIAYIFKEYARGLTVKDLASEAGYAPNYLSYLFKKETGYNIGEYIIHVRIDQAKILLVTTNMKSYNIAEKVGFTDDSYFCKIFKKTTNLSPNNYRKNSYIRYGELTNGLTDMEN